MRPREYDSTGELLAVVRADDRRLAAHGAHIVQHVHQVIAADAVLGYHGHRLVCGVVNNGQALEPPSGGDAVENEVH